jgi:hypothetical protein
MAVVQRSVRFTRTKLQWAQLQCDPLPAPLYAVPMLYYLERETRR